MFAHFVPMPIGHRGVSFRYPDGVVEEVLPNDTAEAPKNSLRIRYADGERQKWVRPEELSNTVQRM